MAIDAKKTMNIESFEIIATMLYKLASLGVGLVSLYFGYKLFLAGIVGNAGTVKLTVPMGDTPNNSQSRVNLTLRDAAPGIFFALFGTIIITISIVMSFKIENYPDIQQQAILPPIVHEVPPN